jgi:hypothetical protein
VGTVLVNKRKSNRRATFFERGVFREPLRWVDGCQPLANWVAAEFIDQGHSSGRVGGLVSLGGDAVDDDFGEAILRDDAGGRPERGGQDGPVFVNLVIRGFACEG